jgi:hypothetical protein
VHRLGPRRERAGPALLDVAGGALGEGGVDALLVLLRFLEVDGGEAHLGVALGAQPRGFDDDGLEPVVETGEELALGHPVALLHDDLLEDLLQRRHQLDLAARRDETAEALVAQASAVLPVQRGAGEGGDDGGGRDGRGETGSTTGGVIVHAIGIGAGCRGLSGTSPEPDRPWHSVATRGGTPITATRALPRLPQPKRRCRSTRHSGIALGQARFDSDDRCWRGSRSSTRPFRPRRPETTAVSHESHAYKLLNRLYRFVLQRLRQHEPVAVALAPAGGMWRGIETLEPRILYSATPLVEMLAPPPDAGATAVDLDAEQALTGNDRLTGLENVAEAFADEEAHEGRRELVIIDAATPDYERLVDDLLGAPDDGRRVDVVILDAGRDGVAQISEILAEYGDLDAIHIVSHGTESGVQLGNVWLTGDAATSPARPMVARWSTRSRASPAPTWPRART